MGPPFRASPRGGATRKHHRDGRVNFWSHFKVKRSAGEAKAGAAKKKLAEAAKKGLPDSVLRQLADEANASAEIAEVTVKRYVVNDATVEKLGELLRENPRCLFQYRDELSGFFRAMDDLPFRRPSAER